ncbi:MAG: 5'/3'-nucleotidase SurE [Chloroflexi bacterium]|nr:5'/3'-nucleotidase SurE [Chloroflexota bacterium]
MTHILVTNDDGVNAPGILALAQALRALGTVSVMAPKFNQSASGHKKTLFQDIPVEETTLADGTPALAISGSPADCIALAALGVAKYWPPDIVVSGINRGANMGQDITYSGTVTAALEAAIQGVRAVAVSMAHRSADTVAEYQTAAQVAVTVVRHALAKTMPPLTILNLNVPYGPHIKGLRLTRQGVRNYRDELSQKGHIWQIVGPEPGGNTEEEGTDLWAVHNGYASLTPLHLDLTAHRFLADLAAWDVKLAPDTTSAQTVPTGD